MKRIKIKFLPVVLILIFAIGCRENSENIFRVEKGTFRVTITETGELQAVRSKVITMPSFSWDYGRPKITALEKEGKMVTKGEGNWPQQGKEKGPSDLYGLSWL